MSPLDDPRPLADVLRDWMAAHAVGRRGNVTAYRAAQLLRLSEDTVRRLLEGRTQAAYEWGVRCAMTLVDEGRA